MSLKLPLPLVTKRPQRHGYVRPSVNRTCALVDRASSTRCGLESSNSAYTASPLCLLDHHILFDARLASWPLFIPLRCV